MSCKVMRMKQVQAVTLMSKYSGVNGYDPETEQQSSQWESMQCPKPKKAFIIIMWY